MAFEPGQQIGAYRIIRLLGEGGMGAVYEVEHEKLGVRYALKAFSTENKHAEALKRKFLDEGKVLARLRDPHLVRAFDLDFDESTGTPYFVMDLVLSEDGNPLAYTAEHLNDYKHLLDYRPFALRHACIVASQGLKPSITTRYQVWQARLTKCDFACVKVRTRQLTALVDECGKVSYA